MSSALIPNKMAPTNETTITSEKEFQPPDPLGEEEALDGDVVANSTQEPPVQYPSGLTLAIIVGSMMMAMFLVAIDQSIVATAIPKITDEFHDLAEISWYGAVYYLTLGGFRAFWGKAYKFFPLKLTFIFTIFLFEIGSLICGVAPNSIALIIGRAISGVGGAGIATGATTIVTFSAPPIKRPTYMGLLGSTYNFAAVFGPLIGGAFAYSVTWRWCFYINLPFGGLVAGLILIFFRLDTAAKTIKASWKETFLMMDTVGITLIMSGSVCFVLALQYAGTTYPWKSSQVIGLLVGFVLIMLTLIIWENHLGEYAMFPKRLMKQRTLWAPAIFQFFFAGSEFLIIYYIPIYFQSILGATPIKSGVDNLPLIIALGIFLLAGGFIVSAIGYTTPFMMIGASLTCVSAGLFYSMDSDTSSAKWIGYQILAGAAIGIPYMNALNIAQASVDDKDIASVSSVVQFFQTVGGTFSISAAQSAFVNRLVTTLSTSAPGVDSTLVIATGAAELRTVFSKSELPGIIHAYTNGIKAAFAVSIGMAGISVVMSLFCPWSRLASHSKADKSEKQAVTEMLDNGGTGAATHVKE